MKPIHLAILPLMGLGGLAHAADLTNGDSTEHVYVVAYDRHGSLPKKIAAGQTISDICGRRACTITVTGVGVVRVSGDESVVIKDGAIKKSAR